MIRHRRNSFVLALTLFGLASACQPAANKSPSEEHAIQPTITSVSPASPTKPITDDKRQVIVAFGDSLTAGVTGRSYPEQLQTLIDSNHLGYRVDNQGVSGDTSTDGLARIRNVLAAKPKLVILEFGGNDGLRGVPIAATKSNLNSMIQQIKAEKIPLVLLGITLPPNYGPDYVQPFTAMFPALARDNGVTLMPFLLQNVYQNSQLMQPDGIHPNEQGNAIVAKDVFKLIRPMLSTQ